MTTVVFMGTPQFAVPILQGIIDHGYQVLAVVTQPDRVVGRKKKLQMSPVKQAALTNGITVLQPEKISGSTAMQQITMMAPDLIITAAYGQFLPTALLNSAKIAAINVHGSLLPKYRGGAPIQYAIKNNDDVTGITIMYMAKKMDAGDIITQASLPILPTDDAGSVFEKLSYLGRDLLLKTLPQIIDGTAPRLPQDESQVTFAYNIKPEEEQIDINCSARQISGLVRALRPQPGAYCDFAGKRTKLWDITVLDQENDEQPGVVVAKTKKTLVIAAGKHTTFAINCLQPAGKAKQPIQAYLNGLGRNINIGDKVITNDN